MYLGM